MKKLINIFVALVLILGFSSCYEESSWFDDNVTSEDKHFPVIVGITENSSGPYSIENQIDFTLYYWSIEEIKGVNLYEQIDTTIIYIKEINAAMDTIYADSLRNIMPMTLVETKPYTANFDEIQQCDRMELGYTVPTNASNKLVTITIEVDNKNTLTRERNFGFDITD